MAKSLKRYAAKRDKTEHEIVDGMRAVGAKVYLTDKPLDAIVIFRGVVYLAEIKTGKKKLTPDQQKFIAESESENVFVARTLGEALYEIGAVGNLDG